MNTYIYLLKNVFHSFQIFDAFLPCDVYPTGYSWQMGCSLAVPAIMPCIFFIVPHSWTFIDFSDFRSKVFGELKLFSCWSCPNEILVSNISLYNLRYFSCWLGLSSLFCYFALVCCARSEIFGFLFLHFRTITLRKPWRWEIFLKSFMLIMVYVLLPFLVSGNMFSLEGLSALKSSQCSSLLIFVIFT